MVKTHRSPVYELVTIIEPGRTVVDSGGFVTWYRSVEPRLRRALTATYGPERGREATAEALAWAWEHQDRLSGLDNPVAYLYRVGQSRTRLRRATPFFHRVEWAEPWVEPRLGTAVSKLSERQRVAVVLIAGYGWTLAEVAELFGIKVTSVQNHLERALARLRFELEVSEDAGYR